LARSPTAYRITPKLVADHAGANVVCLAHAGLGRGFRLYAKRPGAELNRRLVVADSSRGWQWVAASEPRAALPATWGQPVQKDEPATTPLIRVDIVGALEQRAGFYDQPDGCFGWSDGHDAICERLCAAFAEGDVLLVVDSPGGAAMGLAEAVERAQKSKLAHGRRVTAIPQYQIGSAAYWWTTGIADELLITAQSQVGSIGVRGQHTSIAGHLAKEGIEVTYFADPPEKVAFAPERELDAVGHQRGNRDVKIAADAFRAAVCGSAVGERHGLTPEQLVELGADMLTGQAAVDAGLADGVATEDEVIEYALSLTSESARAIEDEAAAAVAAKTRNTAPRRAA
jgi:ClpP class serine protease